jgi:hypothetical protein
MRDRLTRASRTVGFDLAAGENVQLFLPGGMSVTVTMVKPGRYEDFLKTQTQSEALLVKSGAKNPRLIAAMPAGEASGSLVSTWKTTIGPSTARSSKLRRYSTLRMDA